MPSFIIVRGRSAKPSNLDDIQLSPPMVSARLVPSTQSIRWVKIKTKMLGGCMSVGFTIAMEDSRLHARDMAPQTWAIRSFDSSESLSSHQPLFHLILCLTPGSWSLAFLHLWMSMTSRPCVVGYAAVNAGSAIKGHRTAPLSTS